MSSPEMKPTSRQAARRKLLGGAFSAPAVLTLYSGNALAAGSSLRCLTYQVNSASTTRAYISGTDLWVRVPLYNLTTDLNRYFIKGSDVFGKWVTGHTKSTWGIQSTQYQEYFLTSNTLATSAVSGDPGCSTGNCGKWVSLRFDANGNITGCGLTGSGSAMPGTCWMSAAPFV